MLTRIIARRKNIEVRNKYVSCLFSSCARSWTRRTRTSFRSGGSCHPALRMEMTSTWSPRFASVSAYRMTRLSASYNVYPTMQTLISRLFPDACGPFPLEHIFQMRLTDLREGSSDVELWSFIGIHPRASEDQA